MKELAETEAIYFVDAGDAFFKSPYIVQSKRESLTATAQAVLSAYNVMNCQVINIGANDLAGGREFIRELQNQAEFPFISANIKDADTDKQMFESSIIVETHDHKLGFVGVTSGDKRLKKFTFDDPIESAKQAVAAIKDNVDLVFLLANVDDRTELRLAQEISDIDFLIRSKTGSLHRNPKEHNGVIVVRSGKQGKYATALKIRRVDGVSKMKNVSAQMKRIKFANNRLDAMSKNLEAGQTLEERYADDAKRMQLISRLQAEKQTNKDLINKLHNSFYFDSVPLNDRVTDAPEIAEIVAEFMPKKNKAKDKTNVKEKARIK